MRGVVVSIQDDGGFGRFKVKGMDDQVGFRQQDVPGGQPLVVGQWATFDTRRTDRGRLRATDIEPEGKPRPPWVVHSAIGMAPAAAVTAVVGLGLGLGHILWWLLVWLVVINLTELAFYKIDKSRAEGGGDRRIAERAIHVVEAAGGSLSAPFARKHFIHKVRAEKRWFRVKSWSILATHLVLVISVGWYVFLR